MKKSQYDHMPSKLEAVGNGSHLYRWEIEQITNPENDILFQCYEVLVWNNPTHNKVTEAAITVMWDKNIEAKLINDYNAANEGMLDAAYKIPYLDFLTQRAELKAEINLYFDNI